MVAPLDLSGRRFGRLTALSVHEKRHGRNFWLCECDCGSRRVVDVGKLAQGRTRSCGCLRRDTAGEHSKTHGMAGSPEFVAWREMRKRCYNPNFERYDRYGGRGITVCDRWRDSFENFYEDMGAKPGPKHSLDRIDNDGDYEPGNCRWATKQEQMANRANSKSLTFRGETKTYPEWAATVGITNQALHGRIKSGWSVERALTEPVNN